MVKYLNILLVLIILVSMIQITQPSNSMVLLTRNYEIHKKPIPMPIYTMLKEYLLEGFDSFSKITTNGKLLMVYTLESSKKILKSWIMDLSTLETTRITWVNVSVIGIDKIVMCGDRIYVAGSYPRYLQYYDKDSGYGVFNIIYNESIGEASIDSIACYNDKIYIRIYELNVESLIRMIYGYIDLEEPGNAKTFHKILEISGRDTYNTDSTTIIYNGTWFDGKIRIRLDTGEYYIDENAWSHPFEQNPHPSPDHRYILNIILGWNEKIIRIYDLATNERIDINIVEYYERSDVYLTNVRWLNNTSFIVLTGKRNLYLTSIDENDHIHTVKINTSNIAPEYLFGVGPNGMIICSYDQVDATLGILRGRTLYNDEVLYQKYPDLLLDSAITDNIIALLYSPNARAKNPVVKIYTRSNITAEPPYITQINVTIRGVEEEYTLRFSIYVENPSGLDIDFGTTIKLLSSTGKSIFEGSGDVIGYEDGKYIIEKSFDRDTIMKARTIVFEVGLTNTYPSNNGSSTMLNYWLQLKIPINLTTIPTTTTQPRITNTTAITTTTSTTTQSSIEETTGTIMRTETTTTTGTTSAQLHSPSSPPPQKGSGQVLSTTVLIGVIIAVLVVIGVIFIFRK